MAETEHNLELSRYRLTRRGSGPQKVAAVTDDKLGSILPRIVDHFVNAEVRHFDFDDQQAAMDWLKSSKAD